MQQHSNDYTETHEVSFLVVGGGIAGVSCAETLAICCPEERTILLTESNIIKTITNLEPIARYLYKFDVRERSAAPGAASSLAPSILTIVDQLSHIESAAKRVITRDRRAITYKYLCLCTGGQAKLIAEGNERVLGIRDTDSVLQLQQRLQTAQRMVLLGNGGIASELAHELHGVEVHWVVKDNHIASTFVDPGAAHFFLQKSDTNKHGEKTAATSVVKRMRYSELQSCAGNSIKRGAALGPDWHRNFMLTGELHDAPNAPIIHYKSQVEEITPNNANYDKIRVKLSSGESIDCDFLVSATGVNPRLDFSCDEKFVLATDGGILVNEMMETNVACTYAAGDVCSAGWEHSKHWFQMRLWTQARQMGAMAGRSMAAAFAGEQIYQDFCFELFGHVTQLFGYSMVLLGLYNGQGLGTDYEILLRSTPGKEYIKFVLQKGQLRGVILIGNTDLAETCENLILNGMDLTPFGDDILNPDIDIEDYFD